LFVLFSKTDARIEQELGFGQAQAFCARNRLSQTCHDLLDDIAREGPSLHRLRRSTHVHEDQRDTAARGKRGEAGIGLQAGNVVDDLGAGVEGR